MRARDGWSIRMADAKIVSVVKSVSRLIRLIDVTFGCHHQLTCPPSSPDHRQITSAGMPKPLNKRHLHSEPFHQRGPFKMSTMICSLWDGGQGDAQWDWYTAVAQRPGVVMDCGSCRTKAKKKKNDASNESHTGNDEWENDGKEWEGKGRLLEEQDVWGGYLSPLIRQHNSSAARRAADTFFSNVQPCESAEASAAKSQRWLMVYRRTLMGDSSPRAAAASVATWVTCNLSPDSEAITVGYTLPLLLVLKHLPSSHSSTSTGCNAVCSPLVCIFPPVLLRH